MNSRDKFIVQTIAYKIPRPLIVRTKANLRRRIAQIKWEQARLTRELEMRELSLTILESRER